MSSSSSDIRHWEKRIKATHNELESDYNGLSSAVARKFRELHDKQARSENTIAGLQDENTRLQEKITRLERREKPKREADQLERQLGMRKRQKLHNNFTGRLLDESRDASTHRQLAAAQSSRAHKERLSSSPQSPYSSRSETLRGDKSPLDPSFAADDPLTLEDHGENDLGNASVGILSSELRNRDSPTTSIDRPRSLTPDQATNALDSDAGECQPLLSSDLDLTPRFPFKVFLGSFTRENDPSTALVVDHDLVSVELLRAVVDQTKGWMEAAIENDCPSWDAVVSVPEQCVWAKAFNQGSCRWTVHYAHFFACMRCANMGRFCFRKHGDDVWLLPLPVEVDGGAHPRSLGSFVIQHDGGKAAMKNHRQLWNTGRC